MKNMASIRAAVLAISCAGPCGWLALHGMAQSTGKSNTGDARVDRLLSQLTLDEKIALIHGAVEPAAENQGQAGYLPGVPRLHIPSLRFADGPPGVLTRHPSQAETATMGVAATFSTEDAEQNGVVIGRECRSLGIDVSLQPFINIDRDITFPRGYNTFGEDPVLTGTIGAAEIRGLQSQHIMAQAKHYIGYDTDADNVYIDDQTLHEIYLAPFADAVKAGVSSVMCSYNHINGLYACGNAKTLKGLLRDELGFQGFVTSDWGATHSVSFLNDGLDLEMPGPSSPESALALLIPSYFNTLPKTAPPPKANDAVVAGIVGDALPEEPPEGPGFTGFGEDTDKRNLRDALADGSVTEAAITRAAGRILYEMDKFGYLDGKSKHTITAHDTEANATIIQKTSEDAAVLLKNEDHALPLKDANLESLALIGPTAGQVDAIGISGERSVGLVERQVSPLEALRKAHPGARITYAVDDDMTGVPIPAALFTHNGHPGLVRIPGQAQAGMAESQLAVSDPEINFTAAKGNPLPPNSAYRWSGTLTVPTAGSYWIYLQMLGGSGTLVIDGRQVGATGAVRGGVHGDIQQAGQDNALPTTDGLDNVRRAVELSAGPHAIELSTTGDTSGAPEQVRLAWQTAEQRQANHDAAIAAARQAKVAVVFVWTRGRPVFHLPGEQDKLVEEIAAVNPSTIVVLNVSQPVALPWLDRVKAVLQMWWPGDEGGWATANLLLGKSSPAGRLPFTWARELSQYASNDPAYPERMARGVNGRTTFTEGIDVGYRWFDRQQSDPLFAFGYGLSYTSFEYSALHVTRAPDGGLDVKVRIRNTGDVAGDEVPQIYLGPPVPAPAGVQFAVRALAAFDRIHLAAGESHELAMHVPARRLQYWAVSDSKWVTPSGRRVVWVGASSRDLRQQAEVD